MCYVMHLRMILVCQGRNNIPLALVLFLMWYGLQKSIKETDDLDIVKLSFEFGKNLGIAFQLIDDVLDFTSHSEQLGKPGVGADLRLGLATAPVLFAASKYPQLNAMIMRRFSQKDDVKKAFEFVIESDGIRETRFLASKYCENAENILNKLGKSQETNFLRHYIRKLTLRDILPSLLPWLFMSAMIPW